VIKRISDMILIRIINEKLIKVKLNVESDK